MIFSSDIRAWVSLLRAVAGGTERRRESTERESERRVIVRELNVLASTCSCQTA